LSLVREPPQDWDQVGFAMLGGVVIGLLVFTMPMLAWWTYYKAAIAHARESREAALSELGRPERRVLLPYFATCVLGGMGALAFARSAGLRGDATHIGPMVAVAMLILGPALMFKAARRNLAAIAYRPGRRGRAGHRSVAQVRESAGVHADQGPSACPR
jgi:hypothetical protein